MTLDLLLVKPGSQKNLYQDLSKSITGIEPPIWAAMLAGHLQNKYSIQILDMEIDSNISNIIRIKSPRLIAIVVYGTNPSASTMNMIGVKSVLEEIKQFSIPTILIGLHPSALPEKTLKEESISMVCEGEGFYTLEDLLSNKNLEDIRGLWYKIDGQIYHNDRAPLIDLSLLEMPAWNLIDLKRYRAHNWHTNFLNIEDRSPYGVIYTSLGCPFNCSFCNINTIFGKHQIRYRSIDKVMDELDYIIKTYGIKHLRILDEMFGLDEDYLIKFCDSIIERKYNLNIWAYTRIDTINRNKLRKMKQAGINWLCPGFESGNEKIRKISNKGKFTNEMMKSVRIMMEEEGINVQGNFMFGLPEDTIETMQDTLNLAEELNCEMVNFYCTMAYPGSKLYNDNIVNNNWECYSQLGYESIPLSTKYLTSSKILKFRDDAFTHYFSRNDYQTMIQQKFGDNAIQNIRAMLNIKLKRKIYG